MILKGLFVFSLSLLLHISPSKEETNKGNYCETQNHKIESHSLDPIKAETIEGVSQVLEMTKEQLDSMGDSCKNRPEEALFKKDSKSFSVVEFFGDYLFGAWANYAFEMILWLSRDVKFSDFYIREHSFLTRAKELGYPAEEHFVETEDGFILRLFRLQAKSNGIQKGLRPIFIQHALLDCADTFISNEEELSFVLAIANELNADLWFGNNRGTKHSKNHTALSCSSPEFWHFSYDEFALYDLPAMLSFVSESTGFESFDFIGHSQGSTQMFAALSEQIPIVQETIRRVFAIGPVVFLYRMASPFGKILMKSRFLEISQAIGVHEWLPFTNVINNLSNFYCKHFKSVCQFLISNIADENGEEYDNTEYIDKILSYEPGGSSVMQIIHYQQNYKTGSPSDPKFAKFDYGNDGNLKVYGVGTAPEYDLSKINKEINLYVGLKDLISTPEDVELLRSKLKTRSSVKYYEKMGHNTFTWSRMTASFLQFKNDLIKDLKE